MAAPLRTPEETDRRGGRSDRAKVLICHNRYQKPGGEDRVYEAEAALLEKRGHDVVRYEVHNEDVRRIDRLTLAGRTIWSQSAYAAVRQLIRRERPTVMHVHNTLPLLSPAVYYAAHAENVPVVQTLHNYRIGCPKGLMFRDGSMCEECVGRAVAWPSVLHRCYRDSYAATAVVATMLAAHRVVGTWRREVDAYVAMTAHGRAKMIDMGLPPSRVYVKPHFLLSDPGPGDGSSGNAVFVGRLDQGKGVHTMLEAWRQLAAEVPLTIIGDGPLAADVAAAAACLPGVRWSGWRSPDEVTQLVGSASCLLFPSEAEESFGLVVIEAFARGTPVVASRTGAARELIRDGDTGLLFDKGDRDGLVAAVRRLHCDPGMRHAMRIAARAEFTERFTANVNYDALMTIYSAAARRDGAGACQVAAHD